jgi:hypothetical protein
VKLETLVIQKGLKTTEQPDKVSLFGGRKKLVVLFGSCFLSARWRMAWDEVIAVSLSDSISHSISSRLFYCTAKDLENNFDSKRVATLCL